VTACGVEKHGRSLVLSSQKRTPSCFRRGTLSWFRHFRTRRPPTSRRTRYINHLNNLIRSDVQIRILGGTYWSVYGHYLGYFLCLQYKIVSMGVHVKHIRFLMLHDATLLYRYEW